MEWRSGNGSSVKCQSVVSPDWQRTDMKAVKGKKDKNLPPTCVN